MSHPGDPNTPQKDLPNWHLQHPGTPQLPFQRDSRSHHDPTIPLRGDPRCPLGVAGASSVGAAASPPGAEVEEEEGGWSGNGRPRSILRGVWGGESGGGIPKML